MLDIGGEGKTKQGDFSTLEQMERVSLGGNGSGSFSSGLLSSTVRSTAQKLAKIMAYQRVRVINA